ncbi:MAG: hypothetical protein DRH44_02840 [Candidatus Coatesbacteria bacterium]|nr:MAG: hypothetical protein DRH44_02840 [Candidatus Coatesbacteria bacterium]
MRVLTIVSILLTTFLLLYADPGDIIRTFDLDGNQGYGIWGLAYDPEDGNIWAAQDKRDDDYSKFCKFRNDEGHEIIQDWQELENNIWVDDIAYPYSYEGKDTLVILDNSTDGPTLMNIYDKETGEYLGRVTNEFLISYGIEASHNGNILYASDWLPGEIYTFYGYNWGWFSDCEEDAVGVAYGWERVFVIHNITPPSIWVFDLDGNLEDEIEVNGWDGYGVSGLSRGRENISGYNESLYVAVYDTHGYSIIYEIEVGDYNTAINSSSVGEIKALFH